MSCSLAWPRDAEYAPVSTRRTMVPENNPVKVLGIRLTPGVSRLNFFTWFYIAMFSTLMLSFLNAFQPFILTNFIGVPKEDLGKYTTLYFICFLALPLPLAFPFPFDLSPEGRTFSDAGPQGPLIWVLISHWLPLKRKYWSP